MAADSRAQKVIWAAAILAGGLVVAGITLLFRMPAPKPAPGAPRTAIGLVRLGGKSADPLLTEKALLFDPTPLFLPTEWNSAHKEYAAKEPGGGSRAPPDELIFDVAALALDLPPPANVPSSPAQALSGDPVGAPFLAMGRIAWSVHALPVRGARVEIVEAGSGRRVFARDLADCRPPGGPSWQPMEFLAAVDAAGLVGPLVPTLRSGVDEVDNFFSHYLAETLRVGNRLPPGFYRITVGP